VESAPGPNPTSAAARRGAARFLDAAIEHLSEVRTHLERYLTCGNPDCKCARGERHGPVWYLSVTLNQSHRAGCTVPGDQVEQVREWIENYRGVKENLEKISDINRELVLRRKKKTKKRKSAEK
jgi:hypothetical protein